MLIFKQNVCVREKFVVVILKAGHFIISSNLSPLLRIHIQLQIVEIIIQQQTSLVHHHLRNQKFHPENVNIWWNLFYSSCELFNTLFPIFGYNKKFVQNNSVSENVHILHSMNICSKFNYLWCHLGISLLQETT